MQENKDNAVPEGVEKPQLNITKEQISQMDEIHSLLRVNFKGVVEAIRDEIPHYNAQTFGYSNYTAEDYKFLGVLAVLVSKLIKKQQNLLNDGQDNKSDSSK